MNLNLHDCNKDYVKKLHCFNPSSRLAKVSHFPQDASCYIQKSKYPCACVWKCFSRKHVYQYPYQFGSIYQLVFRFPNRSSTSGNLLVILWNLKLWCQTIAYQIQTCNLVCDLNSVWKPRSSFEVGFPHLPRVLAFLRNRKTLQTKKREKQSKLSC